MFHGSIVAIITPMHNNGEINYACLRELIDWHIANGTDGIVVAGSTGEAATLTHNELLNVIRAVVEQVNGKIPVIAGTGTNATQKTIELTREAMEIGVDACLLVAPYYNKPTQEGLYQHYRAIAEAVPIPQLLYNVPGRTACDIELETVQRLAGFSNIVGIKEGMPARAQAITANCNGLLDVLSGDDITALEIIKFGGKGVVSVAANIAPRLMHDLCDAALKKDFITAERINQKLHSVFKDLFLETNPIPVKWAMQEMKMASSGIRLPLTPLAAKYQAILRATLQQAGILE